MKSTNNLWTIKARSAGTTPEELWKTACEYFLWCDSSPVYTPELLRSGPRTGDTAYLESPRIYTLSGLSLFCGISPKYIMDMAKNQDAGDYKVVCERILLVIITQNIEQAAVGGFNPIFVAKLQRIGEEQGFQRQVPVINIISHSASAPPLLTNEQDVNFQKSKEQKGETK